jgi:hypothetical protein
VAMGQVYLVVIRLFPVIFIPKLLETYSHVTGAIQILQMAEAIKSAQKQSSDSADYITTVIEFRT